MKLDEKEERGLLWLVVGRTHGALILTTLVGSSSEYPIHQKTLYFLYRTSYF
jgi:hypothetical protein